MERIRDCGKRIWSDIKEYFPAVPVFLLYYNIVHFMGMTFCPLLSITGFPCAGCGLTRSFLFMAVGQFERAAYINPMSYVILVFLLYCGYFRYVRGEKIKGFSFFLGLLITVMLIFYAVRMYLYFPNRIPYVYEKDNLFAKRIPGYSAGIERLLRMIKAAR